MLYAARTGGCGTGPNMMLTPGPVPLRHMATPAKLVDMLRALCALDVPDALLKVLTRRLFACSCSARKAITPTAPCVRKLCKQKIRFSCLCGCLVVFMHRRRSCGWQAMRRPGQVTWNELCSSTHR